MEEAFPAASRYIYQSGDIRPVPDPTVLTSSMIERAKEDIRREIDFVQQILNQRLDAIDTATKLLQHWRDGIPNQRLETLEAYEQVIIERFARVDERFVTMEQKFTSIQTQFVERDTRLEQTSRDSTKALDAALSATKEMGMAQNATTDKRLDQIVGLLNTTTGALDNKISLLTEQAKTTMTRQEVEQLFRTIMDKLDGPTGLSMRLENMVARTTTRNEQSAVTTQSNQWLIGAALGAIALVVALATLALKVAGG